MMLRPSEYCFITMVLFIWHLKCFSNGFLLVPIGVKIYHKIRYWVLDHQAISLSFMIKSAWFFWLEYVGIELHSVKQKKPLTGLWEVLYWRRESNPHSLNRNRILSPACLPVPPLQHLNKFLPGRKEILERKTRFELATPTLARLCSTNWATFAFIKLYLPKTIGMS